jgi:predicted DNA-binding protein YlxM (UPF0122 family)
MRLTQQQINQIPYYYSKGFTAEMIARHYNISHQTVFHHLKSSGYKRPRELTSNEIIKKYNKFKT